MMQLPLGGLDRFEKVWITFWLCVCLTLLAAGLVLRNDFRTYGWLLVVCWLPLGPALLPLSFRIWSNVGGRTNERNPYDTDYHGRKFTYPADDDTWLYFDKEDLDLDDEET
jgi:hypothetical protein